MDTKETILNKLNTLINIDNISKIILSNPIKSNKILKKISIEKILLKTRPTFQVSHFIENQITHKNIQQENFNLELVINFMEDNFKQCEIFANNNIIILMNKKKEFKINKIKKIFQNDSKINPHNKTKNYILKEGEYIDWLFKLGIIDKNGTVLKPVYKKFKQINKFLEMIKDIESYLGKNAKIIDMGCGKSYLTFAMYYYLNVIKNKNVTIKGYDLKKEVVENCNNLAKEFCFSSLTFHNEDIKNLDPKDNINMVISLHACDTATDYAIYFGVKLNCDIILSVPCCQKEIFSQIKNETLSSMLNYGVMKERFSSNLTDTLRADALKLCGYKTNIIEFIDMEHTPKNIMIKAIKNKNFTKNQNKIENFENLLNIFNINPTINQLLKDYFIK